MNTECHLYILPQAESHDNDDTSSDESDLEMVSTVDETDNIAISIKNHFNFDDDKEDKNNEEVTDVSQLNLVLNSDDTELDELNAMLCQLINRPCLLRRQLYQTG